MYNQVILEGLKYHFETLDTISNIRVIYDIHKHILFVSSAIECHSLPIQDITEALRLVKFITSYFAYNISKVKRDVEVAEEFSSAETTFKSVCMRMERMRDWLRNKNVPEQRKIFGHIMSNLAVIKKCIGILKRPLRDVSTLTYFVSLKSNK